MTKQRMVRVSVQRMSYYDTPFCRGTYIDAIVDFLTKHRSAAPQEHRDAVKAVLDIGPEFDSEFEFYYDRPETAAEQKHRTDLEFLRKQHAELSERNEYERLKAKYGS